MLRMEIRELLPALGCFEDRVCTPLSLRKNVVMSSMPVEWHKECHKNAEASHQRLVDGLEAMQERVDRSARDLMRRAQQIARAERLGKTSFDIDKFKPE